MILIRHSARKTSSPTSTLWKNLNSDQFCRSRKVASPLVHSARCLQSQARSAPFAIVDKCPPPTCACAETPSGLDIDQRNSINGTMAPHAQHVLISTGRDDWASRIEDEEQGTFVRELKYRLGPKGKFSNVRGRSDAHRPCDNLLTFPPIKPYHNVMISNSSFYPVTQSGNKTASALLLPSFRLIEGIPEEEQTIDDFIKGFLLPSKLHSSYEAVPTAQSRHLLHDNVSQSRFIDATKDVKDVVVLICGHGGRDERCGIMGPLLRTEFINQLENANVQARTDWSAGSDKSGSDESEGAVVGLVSHIGGHKFAGNVIIYIPPSLLSNPLAGKGIWYGRVEARHVEGIVLQTIKNGIVIRELFRGGLGPGGDVLRL